MKKKTFNINYLLDLTITGALEITEIDGKAMNNLLPKNPFKSERNDENLIVEVFFH